MKKFMIAVVTSLFVMSVGSVSFAGMMDALKGKAEEAKQEATETMEKQEAEPGKAIEAKDATKEEAGGMMDQAKETAKETVNEKIDGLGK
ncbi:MAG: hypothetical protein OEY91_09080 [Nitrospirota bacterium]|nr:hypothetical protein [Nitrospirota bacterium]